MRYKAKIVRSNKEKEGDRDRRGRVRVRKRGERVRKDETIRDLALEQYWTV